MSGLPPRGRGLRGTAWRLLDTGAAPGGWNLALDEALLTLAGDGRSEPTVRFYGWSPPAVSVGYFQQWERQIDPLACRRKGLEVHRRVTGGRAVLHGKEVTYSVVCACGEELFGRGILPAYRSIAVALASGLGRLGVKAQLSSPLRRGEGRVLARHPSCFAASAGHEITVGGRKLVGSAQKRRGGALLQHGSILLAAHAEEFEEILIPGVIGGGPPLMTSLEEVLGRRPDRSAVVEALAEGFREAWGVTLRPGRLTAAETALAGTLAGARRPQAIIPS